MKKIIETLKISTIMVMLLTLAFVTVEPAIGRAVSTSSQMTETLTVTSEISFLTPATNVNLGSISGITGGTTNGQTQVRVLTNNALGYNMTITASSSLGMIGNNGALGGVIPAYTPAVAGVPDWTFTVAANRAEFGYTVEASTTSDVAQPFKWTGTACNSGSTNGSDHCWINASTTAYTIINRATPTPDSGATTTIKFRVQVSSNPSPAIPQDTYVATTTLTATTN